LSKLNGLFVISGLLGLNGIANKSPSSVSSSCSTSSCGPVPDNIPAKLPMLPTVLDLEGRGTTFLHDCGGNVTRGVVEG
jgi:hypothetical protein